MKRTLVMVALGLALGGASALVACGDGTTSSSGNDAGTTNTGPDVTMAKGDNYDFVVDSLSLPKDSKQFSIDLDGDKKVDNGLALIINILGTVNLDAQAGVSDSVTNGDVVVLLSVQSSDKGFTTDDTAGVTLYIGKPMPGMCPDGGIPDGGCPGAPVFNGMGMFAADNSVAPSAFLGKFAASTFKSNDPVTTKLPVKVQLKLALVPGAPPVAIPLNAGHIQFTHQNGKLIDGSLQGAVRAADLNSTVLPAVVKFLNDKVKTDPASATTMMILNLFDTGGCGSAMAMDKVIDLCEVATNGLIKNLLLPDVQIFNPSGSETYGPTPKCTMATCDSLSMGVGFTASGAKIVK